MKESPVQVSEEEVRLCLESFLGESLQIPPMYSAIKINGRRLYELARQGLEVEREARPVHFYDITVLDMALPRVRFSVTCSRGTYIRTLCFDIGKKLGCGGCMESLVRTRVGIFELEDSHTLEQVASSVAETGIPAGLISLDKLFGHLADVALLPEGDKLVHNGNVFHVSYMQKRSRRDWRHLQEVRVYDSEGCFVGIYYYREGHFYLKKMFY